MEVQLERLAHFKFFRGLSEETLQVLAAFGTIRTWESFQYIAQEGEHAGEFYAIESGLVTVEIHRTGMGRHILQTLTDGDVAGWSWLFPPHKWTFDIKAVTAVRAIAFPGNKLLELFTEHPDVGYILVRRLAEVMAQRLQAARLQILDVYGKESHTGISRGQHLAP